MKLYLICLLLPVALAVPVPKEESKRFIFGNISVPTIFDLDALKCDVQIILDVAGSDPTEQACETECHVVVKQGLLDNGCPLVCHALQNLAHYFHEVPKPGDQHDKCGGLYLTTTKST